MCILFLDTKTWAFKLKFYCTLTKIKNARIEAFEK